MTFEFPHAIRLNLGKPFKCHVNLIHQQKTTWFETLDSNH